MRIWRVLSVPLDHPIASPVRLAVRDSATEMSHSWTDFGVCVTAWAGFCGSIFSATAIEFDVFPGGKRCVAVDSDCVGDSEIWKLIDRTAAGDWTEALSRTDSNSNGDVAIASLLGNGTHVYGKVIAIEIACD